MLSTRSGLAFVCHPYHRGGVTTWMADAARAQAEWGRPCWFIAPRPREPFMSGGGRPTLIDLLDARPAGRRPTLIAPAVGAEFEFGTEGYRARVYGRAVQDSVPPGVPVIVSDDAATWRGVELLRGRNPLIGVLHADDAPYYLLASRFSSSTAALVAVSRRIATKTRAILDGDRARVTVIPCGIPLPSVPPDAGERAEIMRLVWVGRISEVQKRVSDLAVIARLLRDAGREFTLDIVGDGEDADALRRNLEENGLQPRVVIHGWLPSASVLSILARSDIMLLPSNFEGMPVAAMEAMAVGCAVVASDTSGLEEYAESAEARDALLVFPRGDARRAVEAIERAWGVPRERRRAAARRLAASEFSIETCLERYDRLVEMLPSTPPPRSSVVRLWHPGDLVSRAVAIARGARADLNRVWSARRSLDPHGTRAVA